MIKDRYNFDTEKYKGVEIGGEMITEPNLSSDIRSIIDNSINGAYLTNQDLLYDEELPDVYYLDFAEKMELLEETKERARQRNIEIENLLKLEEMKKGEKLTEGEKRDKIQELKRANPSQDGNER